METNMGNSELLYEVIDTLSDEEFNQLLNTLDVAEKAEEVVSKKQPTESDIDDDHDPVEEKLEQRKRLISEKLAELEKKDKVLERKKLISEKLDEARKQKQIKEKLEIMRRRAKIQEKLELARKGKKVDINKNVDDIKVKIQEKLELAKKKKAVMKRVNEIRNSKKQ